MNVTIPVPDDFAARFGSDADFGRRALEALALEEYRADRMTRAELQRLLGHADEAALDGFLEARGMAIAVTASGPEDAHRDREGAVDDLVARFRAFAASYTLGGIDIKALISEGRR